MHVKEFEGCKVFQRTVKVKEKRHVKSPAVETVEDCNSEALLNVYDKSRGILNSPEGTLFAVWRDVVVHEAMYLPVQEIEVADDIDADGDVQMCEREEDGVEDHVVSDGDEQSEESEEDESDNTLPQKGCHRSIMWSLQLVHKLQELDVQIDFYSGGLCTSQITAHDSAFEQEHGDHGVFKL